MSSHMEMNDMTDRELLEAAARAAGYDTKGRKFDNGFWFPPTAWWNPLTDDGDALRLAVRLRIDLRFNQNDGYFYANEQEEPAEADLYAATRRAIVRAAAAMAPKEQT